MGKFLIQGRAENQNPHCLTYVCGGVHQALSQTNEIRPTWRRAGPEKMTGTIYEMWGMIFQNPKKRSKRFRIVKLPDFHTGPPWQGEVDVFPYSKLYIPRKSIILEASSLDGKVYHRCGTLPVCSCLSAGECLH
jgi:hypothetical protein